MRLYLSSYRLGNCGDILSEMVGQRRTAAVIVNAYDSAAPADRVRRIEREFESMSSLGITAEELDLREYIRGGHGKLAARLAGQGLVWACGGDPFLLLDTMRASAFDTLLLDLLAQDSLVYGGYSAGAMVLGPAPRGLGRLVPAPGSSVAGLGLLPYLIAPHYRSDGYAETAKVDRIVEHYIDNHVLFKALRDGQVIVVRGDSELVLG